MTAYWRHSPPVHVSVARYLGIKPPTDAATPAKPQDLSDLMATAGPGRGAFVPPIPIHRD